MNIVFSSKPIESFNPQKLTEELGIGVALRTRDDGTEVEADVPEDKLTTVVDAHTGEPTSEERQETKDRDRIKALCTKSSLTTSEIQEALKLLLTYF